jgi:hypothetical protein
MAHTSILSAAAPSSASTLSGDELLQIALWLTPRGALGTHGPTLPSVGALSLLRVVGRPWRDAIDAAAPFSSHVDAAALGLRSPRFLSDDAQLARVPRWLTRGSARPRAAATPRRSATR